MTDPSTTTPPQFPMSRTRPFDPPAGYAALRSQGPISKVTLVNGDTAWAVTSHAEVRRLLADSRLSIDRTSPQFPQVTKYADNNNEAPSNLTPSLLGVDPPEHSALRRPVVAEFTVKRIQQLRPRIQDIVDEHIDAMVAGPQPADLVAALAMPVPSLVICELLGVPYEDHHFFQHHSSGMLNMASDPQQRLGSLMALAGYMDELVSRAEANPGDDLLGRLIVKNRADGSYDHRETCDLARLLLLAGHETTANMISLGTVALLEDPEQLGRLRKDASLWPGAVEELLRYFTIADFVPTRVATDDIEVGANTIRRGEGVILLTASADRDETVFSDPDTLDIDRSARHHVAFGYGVHQCLGQNLARLELEIVYRTLFEQLPDLKLVEHSDNLSYKDDSLVYGLNKVPVTW